MARLSEDNIATNQVQSDKPVAVQKSWLDFLPHNCELPDLWRTGKPLEDCLEIIGQTQKSLNKQCKSSCKSSCTACHSAWQKAAAAMVLQKQVDRAFAGDAAMLTWYGKAVLRQQEPQTSEEQIVPSIINIAGLNVDQESEIDILRRQLIEAQRKLSEAQKADEGGDANAETARPDFK